VALRSGDARDDDSPVIVPAVRPSGDGPVVPPARPAGGLESSAETAAVLTAVLSEELRRRARALLDAVDRPDAEAARALCDAVAAQPVDAIRQLPSAAREALAVCDDPRASVADLARVCEGDVSVAQGLLRYANSAMLARRGQAPAASLCEAIDRVGADGVRNVVVDVTVAGLLCAPGSRHAAYTAQIWTHAHRTAALARTMAPAFGAAPDRAYAAGLLHDVGKLVVLDRAAVLAAGPEYTAPTWPALRAMLLALHEPLGALAVLRWGMGVEAALAVGSHHRTSPPSADPVGEVVHLAERVDLAIVRGAPIELDSWWAAGALSGSVERAGRLVEAHLGPLSASAAA
jgi:HD-like signal output (HDOD) protein